MRKMIPMKLGAVWLLACILTCQAVVEYNDCPQGCKYEEKSIGTIMTCNRLLSDDEKINISVMHFEVVQSTEPLVLKANSFLNMGLEQVNSITISNNSILYLHKQAFLGLPDLATVKIAHTNLSQIHPDLFKTSMNLKKVVLVGNRYLQNISFTSDHLEELVITNCKLQKINPEQFNNIPNLNLVNLKNNEIDTIMSGAFDSLKNLDELYLENNNLKELPKNLFAKNDISVLDLSHNYLETFDGEMMENINKLNISYNNIQLLAPEAFGKMEKLIFLDLSSNDLHNLDENIFVNNSRLQKIILDDNVHLSKLPENGFKVRGYGFDIHFFSCKHCNLQSLPKNTFKSMTAMQTLNLSHNNLTDVSTGVFQNLTNLRNIDLSFNEISTLDRDTFRYNSNLNKVILSHNTLKALHPTAFQKNRNLQFLHISHCGLHKLWTSLTETIKLPSIELLNVSGNNINIISKDDLAVTSAVKYLDISDNPLTCTEDLQVLVEYLHDKDIQNSIYVTHENINIDVDDDRQNYANGWKQIALKACPKQNNEYDEDDKFEDYYEQEIESKLNVYEDTYEKVKTELQNTENEEIPKGAVKPELEDLRYSYVAVVLVFIGTAMVVLAIVTIAILFIIRRRQALHIPKIISSGIMPHLKKNSGLVYQPLSEERDTKTPILGRFVSNGQTTLTDPEINF